ncbi:Plasmid rolling circle replication initiator protein REP and truncated derivatives [Paucidesulfovibrio gracilis DSM 16080]|mgnify:FL=1|uniref:Plasmid rolling circle replication initiator protein REP and truncated derivatives n=4 Tax=Bacteria TaxID=2 RepID=A0A1T4YB07_9BACT|nr:MULTISPECIES: protein rep [Bacteria]KRL42511.1 replication protein [Liquorilactobacillus nagelii DSM 13675]SKA98455.1 Plasmid rolling circle replication initiator protein REP and truncated derivatives [Paucidesulfovibrio gracilis DSM 16080]
MSEIFEDKTENGKVRPWRERKIENVRYAEYLSILEFKRAHDIKNCGETLRFRKIGNHLKLYQTWFCHKRLCPLCNWRRSMKNSSQLKQIIAETVAREPKGRFLFLTLTVKNVNTSEELKTSLRQLTKAFGKLSRYKQVAKNLLGYLRSTEITVNEQDMSYNQHLHVLLFVKSSYFKNSNNYLAQAEWAKLWQKALKVDYEPVVHVQAVKANKRKGTDSLQASAEETAKYEVKSADYMTADDERNLVVIKNLEYALAGTRQISYGGLLKQIKQDLQLEDVENGDLVHVGDEDYTKEQMEAAEEVVAKWDFNKQNYFIW